MLNIIYWYEYIEDISTCFDGTSRQDRFVNILNTIEEETNSGIKQIFGGFFQH